MIQFTSDYHKNLLQRLRDPSYACGYLNAVIEDGDPDVVLLALRDVSNAHGNLSALARESNLSRESLYKILSKRGNPSLSSLSALLKALGLKIQVAPIEAFKKTKQKSATRTPHSSKKSLAAAR